jgi:hypothetical protein
LLRAEFCPPGTASSPGRRNPAIITDLYSSCNPTAGRLGRFLSDYGGQHFAETAQGRSTSVGFRQLRRRPSASSSGRVAWSDGFPYLRDAVYLLVDISGLAFRFPLGRSQSLRACLVFDCCHCYFRPVPGMIGSCSERALATRRSAMRRRDFISFLGGTTAWVATARGEAPRHVIGWLSASSDASSVAGSIAAFYQGMKETGLVEGGM